MTETVKIHGLEGVRKALKRLPKEIRKRELNRSLRVGAKVIQATAKTLAPVGEESFFKTVNNKGWGHYRGTLRNSIVIRSEGKKYLLDAAKIKIGVLSDSRDINKGAWYWRFVEFGTSRQSGKPFLVPAFESMKYVANDLIKRSLLKGVERQARRVKAKK